MSFRTKSKHLSWYLEVIAPITWQEKCVWSNAWHHGGTITFGGNTKERITEVGKIGIHPYPSIDNVFFFERLKHNLLGISQLCDNRYVVSFNKYECIDQNKDGAPLFFAKRKGNLYKIKLGELSNQKVSCLLSVKENH